MNENLTPKLVQNSNDGRLEFKPKVVTRLGYTLPWDINSTQLDCGSTVTSNSGEMAMRLVFHCRVPLSQLETLTEMRRRGTSVKLISSIGDVNVVNFDELKVDRVPDTNGIITNDGQDINEPMYEVQLQSKKEDEDNENIEL